MKFIVYKTTNLKSSINGIPRIYVGVHKTENPDIVDYIGCGVRKSKPSTYSNPKTPFQYAVKKYGVDAFKRETLFIFDTSKEAYDKEAEIVNLNFIKLSHTYNVALGGIGGSLYEQDPRWHSKPIYQFNLNGNLIKEWEFTVDVKDYYGCDISKIATACYDKREYLGYYWSRNNSIKISQYKSDHKKYTYLYNNEGKLINEFPSRSKCAEFIGCNPQSVSNALNNKKSIKGFYVSDNIVDLYIPNSRVSLYDKLLYVYDSNNTFIGTFLGEEVLKILPAKSLVDIYGAYNDNRGWFKDFYISLEAIEKVPRRNKTKEKHIEVYDKNGNLIEVLNSLKETINKYNLNTASLNRYLKEVSFHKDFNFKYANDIV